MIHEFLIALNAVLQKQGIALLPELVVREHLQKQTLVQFAEPIREWSYRYYIAMLPKAPRRRYVTSIIDWLKHDIADNQAG